MPRRRFALLAAVAAALALLAASAGAATHKTSPQPLTQAIPLYVDAPV